MYTYSDVERSSKATSQHLTGLAIYVKQRFSRVRIFLIIFMLMFVQLPGTTSTLAAATNVPDSPTDTPTPVVSETFNEWTLNSGLLYWASRCYGGEFRFPGFLKRLPASGGMQRTLGTIDANHCITYLNMVADSEGVYYYAADDQRIEARSSGLPDVATTVYSPTVSLYPVGERLAADGGYVYWLTSSQLVRVRKDGTDFGTVATGLSSPTDLVAINDAVYWLDATGLWRTSVNCGTLPCDKGQLSTMAGNHLLYYYQGSPILQAGPRLIWVAGQNLQRVSCRDITILCSESTIYTVPADGNPWELGRPATDGTNLFWQEGYFNVNGVNNGRLRRMALGGGTVDDIAVNLYYTPGPAYIHAGYIYFTSVDNSTTDILKLPLNAAALVRDLTADAMEVTQGIQNLANDTPLVAEKATYVRAYGVANSGPSALAVDAYLYGERNGGPLPGSPLHPLNGKRAIITGAGYNRAQRDSGWLFQLPGSWIKAGNVTLRFVVDPLQTYTDANRLDNELSRTASFATRQTVCSIFIPVRTSAPLPTTGIANFWQMLDYAKRLWPTASLRAYHQDEPLEELEVCYWHGIPYPCFGPYELPGDTWKVFTALGIRDLITNDPAACDSPLGNTHYVGMVHPSADTGVTTGTGMTSVFNYAWVKFSNDLAASNNPFAPRSGETLAHEMAHNLGRLHVNCGGPDDIDVGYPYPPSQIDNTGAANHYGFDVKSLRPITPYSAKDFMGYCTPKWTSDYTWKGLYNQLIPFAPANPAATSSPLASAANAILVTGAVTPTASTGELGYAWDYPSAALNANTLQKWQRLNDQNTRAAQNSAVPNVIYHVRLLDSANAILADNPVVPAAPDIHEGASPVQIFLATFPAPTGAVAKIELLQDNAVLASRTPGASVPVVSIIKPAGGEVIADHIDLSWQAQDADRNDVLHYSIQYSPDNGVNWRSLAADIVGVPGSATTSMTLQVSGIPGSLPAGALIRIAASDGYNTGFAVSQSFTVSNRKPEPFILTPAPGETTPAGQSALLRGAASDSEDGNLSGDSLSWTADGQPVGNGEEVNVAGFAPGDHPVELTARDSISQTAAAQATLTILPLSIPSGTTPTLDGSCDDPGYAAASQVLLKPYGADAQASVHLLRDNSAVWACFTGLKPGALSPGAFVGVRVDSNYSRDNLAQASDNGFFVGEDGGVLTLAGDGAGGFANPGPGGLQAQISSAGSAWSAELRIVAVNIGGLDHVVGLNLGHYQVNSQGDDYVWPYASILNQPSTWATTALATLPVIDHLTPVSDTVGDPGFTLVISGQNFLSGAQVLWNGTALSTTFGASSLISATVGAPQLSAAGTIPIVVRNPGSIDSGPALFTLRNPKPAITGLLPGSTQAEGPAFTLVVNGNNFVNGARILWNGQEVPTTFVNGSQLTAQINADLIFEGQVASITVLNPGPGAEVSTEALFTVQPKSTIQLPMVVK